MGSGFWPLQLYLVNSVSERQPPLLQFTAISPTVNGRLPLLLPGVRDTADDDDDDDDDDIGSTFFAFSDTLLSACG